MTQVIKINQNYKTSIEIFNQEITGTSDIYITTDRAKKVVAGVYHVRNGKVTMRATPSKEADIEAGSPYWIDVPALKELEQHGFEDITNLYSAIQVQAESSSVVYFLKIIVTI